MPWSPISKKFLLPVLMRIKDKERISINELKEIFVQETLIMSVNTFKQFVDGLIILKIAERTENPNVLKIDRNNIEATIERLTKGG
ncbi:MAG: hypothetical protein QXW34_02190 [Candidatus Methanomethyliaceae archaeon]